MANYSAKTKNPDFTNMVSYFTEDSLPITNEDHELINPYSQNFWKEGAKGETLKVLVRGAHYCSTITFTFPACGVNNLAFYAYIKALSILEETCQSTAGMTVTVMAENYQVIGVFKLPDYRGDIDFPGTQAMEMILDEYEFEIACIRGYALLQQKAGREPDVKLNLRWHDFVSAMITRFPIFEGSTAKELEDEVICTVSAIPVDEPTGVLQINDYVAEKFKEFIQKNEVFPASEVKEPVTLQQAMNTISVSQIMNDCKEQLMRDMQKYEETLMKDTENYRTAILKQLFD